MKFLVLGAGQAGYAVIFDLIRSPRLDKVIVADRNVERLRLIKERLADEKIVPVELDVTNAEETANLMANSDVTLSCITSPYNYELAKIALQAKSHFCDLGGDEPTFKKQLFLDDVAKEQGVTIIPNIGMVPGMVAILAHCAAQSMDELYEIRMRAGAVPIEPESLLLQHSLSLSVDRLINEYSNSCKIVRDGKIYKVPSLTDVENIEFPKPIGKLEAFNTAGGVSALAETFGDKVQHLDFKMIRVPGHCEQMKILRDLGLMDTGARKLPDGNDVRPLDFFKQLLKEKMPVDQPDLVVMRVTVTGVKDKKPIQHVWECVDYGDQANGISAAAKMTAFPASIIGQMIARKDIEERGVLRQEQAVPIKLFLAEMASRGISLTMAERSPVHEAI